MSNPNRSISRLGASPGFFGEVFGETTGASAGPLKIWVGGNSTLSAFCSGRVSRGATAADSLGSGWRALGEQTAAPGHGPNHRFARARFGGVAAKSSTRDVLGY